MPVLMPTVAVPKAVGVAVAMSGLGCSRGEDGGEERSPAKHAPVTYREEGGGGSHSACLNLFLGEFRKFLGLHALVAGAGLQGEVRQHQEPGVLRGGDICQPRRYMSLRELSTQVIYCRPSLKLISNNNSQERYVCV